MPVPVITWYRLTEESFFLEKGKAIRKVGEKNERLRSDHH